MGDRCGPILPTHGEGGAQVVHFAGVGGIRVFLQVRFDGGLDGRGVPGQQIRMGFPDVEAGEEGIFGKGNIAAVKKRTACPVGGPEMEKPDGFPLAALRIGFEETFRLLFDGRVVAGLDDGFPVCALRGKILDPQIELPVRENEEAQTLEPVAHGLHRRIVDRFLDEAQDHPIHDGATGFTRVLLDRT